MILESLISGICLIIYAMTIKRETIKTILSLTRPHHPHLMLPWINVKRAKTIEGAVKYLQAHILDRSIGCVRNLLALYL